MNRVTAFDITPHDANALTAPTNEKPTDRRVRSIIASLTGSCALMMTGFGIATPVFARRLGELGAGVEVLSLIAMASAFAQFLLAPFMGALADRFGRRPFVLLALPGLAITNVAFLVARSTEAYIVLRFLQGAFSVGMLPAAMGMIADLVPEQHRTRWVGVIRSIFTVAALTMLAAAVLAFAVLKLQGQAKAHALADASVDADRRVAATILTTRTLVEVAPAIRESASRLTAKTGDVVCALRRATSPLASQIQYNEEVGKDVVERVAA